MKPGLLRLVLEMGHLKSAMWGPPVMQIRDARRSPKPSFSFPVLQPPAYFRTFYQTCTIAYRVVNVGLWLHGRVKRI